MENKKFTEVNESEMLEEIRMLLDLTIEQFVYEMSWPNTKYYDFIKNGRKKQKGTTDSSGVERIATHPTIHKVFVGINNAIANYPNWDLKKQEITQIVISFLLPSVKIRW